MLITLLQVLKSFLQACFQFAGGSHEVAQQFGCSVMPADTIPSCPLAFVSRGIGLLASVCFQAFALQLEALVPVHIGYLSDLSLQIVTAGAKQGSKKVARNKA